MRVQNKLTKQYSQRKESVSSNSSVPNGTTYLSKSRIPLPNAVKNMVSSDEPTGKHTLKTQKSQMLRQPYLGNQLNDNDAFEYNSVDHQTHRRCPTNNREMELHELEPTILDYSTEEFTDEAQNNLVVNLEDLVMEEYYINHISEAIHKRKPVLGFCQQWWSVTEASSVKEMQIFFQEPASRKLIKTEQILL